jgi:hypothetical protein
MLRQPFGDQTVFEVTLYNREVRALVKDNQSHLLFEDFWADAQTRDVVAGSEQEARSVIESRFPEDAGFVIQDVHRCTGH